MDMSKILPENTTCLLLCDIKLKAHDVKNNYRVGNFSLKSSFGGQS